MDYGMDQISINPSTWSAENVITWANQVNLPAATVTTLAQNEVDGPTLVTLSKSELQSELGLSSLPARRYLWELIKRLRSEQVTSDYSTAITFHEEEMQHLGQSVADGADAASGGRGASSRSSMNAVVNELATDVQKQRQLIEDHMMAHHLQREINIGQSVCTDAELAHQEHESLLQLHNQVERDLEYAESLAIGRERTAVNARRREREDETMSSAVNNTKAATRVSSLFGLCVQTCAKNKVNVAEAFGGGKVRPLSIPVVSDDEATDEEEDRKVAALPGEVFNLPLITSCNACYEENIKGYSLACGHVQCIPCMRRLFTLALGDNSLLPLRCCAIPIDMHIAFHLLDPDDARVINQRVEEREARNKMYCPSCNAFYNFDLVDSSSCVDFQCGCGTDLCIECKTTFHPNLTCRENQAVYSGSDEMVLELSRENGWKQCPKCSGMIELRTGCNHMVCAYCTNEFCYRCLREWNTKNAQCSSGSCDLWDEDRLLEATEERVRQEEQAQGWRMPPVVRRERLHHAMAGLQANEICNHHWERRNSNKGACPNCDFQMYAYGMRCMSDCGSVVCYTCAHHRIPERGWR